MAADLAVANVTQPANVERSGRRAGKVVRAAAGVLTAAAVLFGLGLRIWSIGRFTINSDEAIVGLMAHEILNGHFFAFYWGQNYGGVEPYLTVVLFGLFGQSNLTLSLTPVILDAAAALLVWRIGRRLFQPVVGVGAAVLFWLWPEVYIHQSTIEYGFRWATLVLGLSMLLLALRLCDDPPTPRPRLVVLRDWVLLGGCFGLGWWSDPEIAYYAIPSALLLLYFIARRGLRPGVAGATGAVLAAVLGALPWLWDNLGHGFPSLRAGAQPDPGFVRHLHLFVTYVLPMALGLKLRGTGVWLFYSPLAKAAYLLAVVAGAAFLVACLVRRRAVVLVVCAVLAPVLYAYWPQTWYWEDGRYGVFLAPIASLIGAAALQRAFALLRLRSVPVLARLPVQQLAGAVLAVVVGVALTLGAIGRLAPYEQPAPAQASWLTWQANRNSYLQPTIAALEAAGVTHVYAGYWVGEVLAFEADGRLTVSDITYPSPGTRYGPYFESIQSSEKTAWLYPNPRDGPALGAAGLPVGDLPPGCIGGLPEPGGSSCVKMGELERYLDQTDDAYHVVPAGGFLAVLPANPVLTEAALASVGAKP